MATLPTFEQMQAQAKEAGAYALACEGSRLTRCIENQANDRGTSDRALMALIVRAAHACAQANVLKYGSGDWAAVGLADTLSRIDAYPECEECDC